MIGPVTIRALQNRVGATPDGVWGPETTRKLQTYLNGL
jgi:murein L,D-transpeptidase YcbB/YkuD